MASASRPEESTLPTVVRQRAVPGSDDDPSAITASQNIPQLPFDTADDTRDADPRVDAPRTLTQWDVAALIINKMIGTGIFTGPYTVLVDTHSKSIAMGLWAMGFGYTILSMLMYLEYARKLPFTGGELVYLDDLLPRFRLWAYTLYAFYFIFVYTTSTNAMQFASQLVLASYKKASWSDLPQDDISLNLLRFLAVSIITATCLLLYLSNSKSRLLNKATAVTKVLSLLVIAMFGAAYLVRNGSNPNWVADDSIAHEVKWVPAFIVVLYSFHGWENATLVAGEIPSFSILKWGFIWGVSIVGSLYLLVAGILGAAFNWEEGPPPNFTAAYFSTKSKPGGPVSETAAVATAVLIALSAVGSMISVAYTGVRVKQSIGWTNILPWSWLWRRTGPLRPKYSWREVNAEREVTLIFDQDALTHPGSPEGGVILYWLTTVVWICLSASSTDITYAVNFAGNMLVYGHFFVEGLVGIGFIWFDPFQDRFQNTGYPALDWYRKESDRNPAAWMRQVPAQKGQYWSLNRLRDGPLQTLLGVIILAFSLVIVISDPIAQADGRAALAVIGGVLAVGWIYWWLFVRYDSAVHIYKLLGYDLIQHTHGVDDFPSDPTRICHWCISLHTGHRHPHDSYLSFNEFLLRGKPRPRLLYTIFGDGSQAAYLIRSWSDFVAALRGSLSSDETDPLNNSIPLETEPRIYRNNYI
ncbi:putative Amino acid transporter transmembrane domain-containing protein [Seiridium cardinale]|uniref:Amino acid transporter transmembrane domain-containing protein n=1 Tax=Seiridium cardinale TaxID=138064 RepID=A0ABR2Y3B9_9PEZI